MNWMEINDMRLEVRLIAGPPGPAPIIFLHEGLGSVSMWTQRGLDWPQAVCAAAGRAGVVYSRGGYGQSGPGPGKRAGSDGRPRCEPLPDYMHREAWEVLPALLQKLQIDNPVLLGHSDGATIALLYTSRFPVSACIAMAPHVIVEDISIRSIAQARTAFESSGPGGLRERLARYHADVEGAFWQWNDVWLSSGFRSFDIRRECTAIQAPVLAIQGCDDPYGTMAQIQQIDLPETQIQRVALPACGHSPHRDAAAATLEHITEFLARRA